MVLQVELLLAEDRRQACKELSEKADFSTGGIHDILHRHLDKQFLENGVILLHDNASVHVSQSLLDMLDALD